jgi:hypothetical protein
VPGVRANANQYLASTPATWLNGTLVFVAAVVTKHNPEGMRFENGPISVRSVSNGANNDWWVFPYDSSNCIGMQRQQSGIRQDYSVANPPVILKENIAARTAYVPQFQGALSKHVSFTRDAPVYLHEQPYLMAVVAQKNFGTSAQFLSIIKTLTTLGSSRSSPDSPWWLVGSEGYPRDTYIHYNFTNVPTLYMLWRESLNKQPLARVNGRNLAFQRWSPDYIRVPSNTYTTLSINDRWSDNHPVMFGKIYEIMVLTGPLKEPHHRIIEGYMAWKWGLEKSLPRSHPYYRVPPGK